MIDPFIAFCNEEGLTPDEVITAYMNPTAIQTIAGRIDEDLSDIYYKFNERWPIK